MPYYDKSEDWLHQSTLLIRARPLTTRITTSYGIKPAHRFTKVEKLAGTATSEGKNADKPPRGKLILKTYDPVSGSCLKYATSKAAEVSRLIQMLGTLARTMAGGPQSEVEQQPAVAAEKDEVMADAPPSGGGVAESSANRSGAGTPVSAAAAAAAAASTGSAGGGGGGKGKKKKGKR
ncbi:signal recognition particle 9 kDa protein-domain-containing protein [Apodospora peruviana]|uniref:Signal recognition particle 9 kDa protein-domain-containing protein n=1 Tax=Apodospora peruviana TaxID=516989 RepID=A0AAE0HWC4_9PEZI|nr:signal recognition particle 9 kDa protein-domain-containing protein [Apodospora peruviana]